MIEVSERTVVKEKLDLLDVALHVASRLPYIH